jgi:endonuclease YncB( thermonuclease family)
MSSSELVLSPAAYERLARDLRRIVTDARERARDAVAREAARAHWELGRRLVRERLAARPRARLMTRLALDLEMDVRTLQRCVAFHRAYPEGPPVGLAWSHVRELLKLSDPVVRRRFTELVREERLSVRQLAAAVRGDAALAVPAVPTVAPEGRLERPADPTYIYAAEVLRVVDGDTLDLRIDLGFDVDKRHRIRLAGVDVAERGTEKGERALRYVEEALAGVASVVIQTRKFDLHGRYVAHLFYAVEERPIGEVFATGRYLNQDLLELGFAVLYVP